MMLDRGALPRLALINPNTNAVTTAAMVGIARAADPGITVEGMTAPFGVPLITTPEQLAQAGMAVEAVCASLPAGAVDACIIAAFGDPGLDAARERLGVPVTGLAEAGLLAAAEHGRFSVVTTTPALVAAIEGLAARYGCAQALASIRLTAGDPAETMRDPARLIEALHQACREAMEKDGARAIVIGGGPLAAAARALSAQLSVPVIEPIPAAVNRIVREVGRARVAHAPRSPG